jgi:hypothetical protein
MTAQLTPAGFTPTSLARTTRNPPARAQAETTTPRSWLDRLLRRREPTVYHRCLAVHIHHAGPHSALS